MKRVIINRKPLDVPLDVERCLYILHRAGGIAPLSDFNAGRGTMLPQCDINVFTGRWRNAEFGMRKVYRGGCGNTLRTKAFFADHPQHSYCVVANLRRVRAILRNLGYEDFKPVGNA